MRRKKIDLFKFALRKKADRDLRPLLAGVFHDQGFRGATTGHILCAIREEYPAEYEGKVIDKNNLIIPGNVPNWRYCIQRTTDENAIDFDWKLWKVAIKPAIATAKKLNTKAMAKIQGPVSAAHFEGKLFLRFLDFLHSYPDCTVYYTKTDHPLKAENKNGDVCIIMPHTIKDDSNFLIVSIP